MVTASGHAKGHIPVAVHGVAVNGDQLIPHPRPGRLQGGAFCELADGSGGKDFLGDQDPRHQQQPQDDVEHAPGYHHQDALPHRLVPKGVFIPAALDRGGAPIVLLAQKDAGAPVVPFIFPLHGAEAANGQQPQGIVRLPFPEAENFRPHADSKFVYLYLRGLGQQEMAQFVEKDHEPEKEHPNHR